MILVYAHLEQLLHLMIWNDFVFFISKALKLNFASAKDT